MRVLLAEEEAELGRGLKCLLEKHRMAVDLVHNGEDALEFFHRFQYDVAVLNMSMPGMDGLSVLGQIRKENSSIAVMLVTPRDGVDDRIVGLEAGADDCLSKSFVHGEFLARVKALSRRSVRKYCGSILCFGGIQLDCNRYELCCQEDVVRLNNKEFQLMELFFKHPHFVFSTEYLMDKIWGMDSVAGADAVWTYIGFLRKKLKILHSDIEIKNMRGAGYSLEKIKNL